MINRSKLFKTALILILLEIVLIDNNLSGAVWPITGYLRVKARFDRTINHLSN
jgi:hypothetical protein